MKKIKRKIKFMRCRECEGLYLVPPGCDYTIIFSDPDCEHCEINNEQSRKKKGVLYGDKTTVR